MEDTNIKELEILAHSLGIELEYSKKIIPIRNFFCASEGHNDYNTLLSLESKELMIRYSKFGVQYFSVTEKGKEVFENWFSLYFLPKKKKRKKKVSAVITMDVQCPYCLHNENVFSDYYNDVDGQIILGNTKNEISCYDCGEEFIINEVLS